MYVYDQNKQVKVRPDGTTRPIGIAPPIAAPEIEYGVPAWVNIVDGQAATNWTASGGASAPSANDRIAATSITKILYNSGSTGWCCIVPSIPTPLFVDRMQLILSGTETVIAREYHPSAGPSTTVAAIQYDIGTSGLCDIVLTAPILPLLERNSVLFLNGVEYVRVLAVILSPDGTTYSIRCSTTTTVAATQTVAFSASIFTYTTITHANGDSIAKKFISLAQSTAVIGLAIYTPPSPLDISTAGGRPINPANDYLSIQLNGAFAATSLIQVALTMGSPSGFSFSTPSNSLVWTIPVDPAWTYAAAWFEIILPISAAKVVGLNPSLSSIGGLVVGVTETTGFNWGVGDAYLFGTYGPVIQPNSPVGYVYQYRYRDSTTGAHSVPGPQTRYQIFPLRESVIITTVAASGLFAFVDTADIYRAGGLITPPAATTTLYVGSTSNGGSLTDTIPDDAVLALDQPPDLTSLQPWPILQLPIKGTASIIGTHLSITGGSAVFDQNMLSNTAININGVEYLTYGQPTDNSNVFLTQSGGLQASTFSIPSPTLAGQTLPYAFGPLEGPFAPVVFALGDPINGGNLYFSNTSDADSASDTNFLEESVPSSDLVSGNVWNGLVFVGTEDDIFCTRYSYLTTLGASTNTSFQWSRVPSPSGIWSRWACCHTPIGVAFLGRDGIYIATDNGAVSITDEKLYGLFPHAGQAATPIVQGATVTVFPVDMTRPQFLRLSYCDEELRFTYSDTQGTFFTLIYQIYKKRWFLDGYADNLSFHYLEELPAVATGGAAATHSQSILALDIQSNQIVRMGGNTDNGALITSLVLIPSLDGGDERSQKLYVDSMTQAGGGAGTITVRPVFNSGQVIPYPDSPVAVSAATIQNQQNMASQGDLSLYRNAGALFIWTGGPAGPNLFAWEVSGFVQPYLSKFFVTQYISLSFPGWKHHRRMYPALISNHPVLLTIKTQDGRTYGPYTIPSTGGQFRILPQMLDQTIKDLAFSYQLDGQGNTFALFPSDFTIETKQWNEDSFISLAVFKA